MTFPEIQPGRKLPDIGCPEALEWAKAEQKHAEAFVNVIRSKQFPVYLWGDVGVGKTCLAALAYACWPTKFVRFYTLPEFLKWAMQSKRDGSAVIGGFEYHDWRLWDSFVDSPEFLVVDDIGVREPTDPQREAFYELVNRRALKPTIYTSNLPYEAIAKMFDDRIASRILRGSILQLAGPDRRMEGSQAMVARAAG